MKVELDLITIFTDEIEAMRNFYKQVIGLEIKNELDGYVEFEMEQVRFAICTRTTMEQFSSEYSKMRKGNNFELAFKCDTKGELDKLYEYIISNGGTAIYPPETMPWAHYTGLFTDPDGNIHELFVAEE